MKKWSFRSGCLLVFLLVFGGSWAQCLPGEIALTFKIYTDPWGYETYWELVPSGNPCGVGTLAWGSNASTVGCSGAGEQNADGSGYPSNALVQPPAVCLAEGQAYDLHFVDDWGDGGLVFELFESGSLTGLYVGSGAGNVWTFTAGESALPAHDSPCNAAEVLAGNGQAIGLDNRNCAVQLGEIQPPVGATCQAQGIWCDEGATRTVWAHWVVPDEGHYQFSTCHHGTQVDTQLAVWTGADCTSMEDFVLVSANDDAFGGCSAPDCVEPPSCVDVASWAYNRVIDSIPACCSSGWTEACSLLYDSYVADCSEPDGGCTYTLVGHDTYGDGWNGCQVTWVVNGVAQVLTFETGHEAQWALEVNPGDVLALYWTPGGWPEEASFSLLDAQGDPIYETGTSPFEGLHYAGEAACAAGFGAHAQAARCTVGCLPAGTSCWIQVDGHGAEAGPIILTIKAIEPPDAIVAQVTSAVCPGGIGLPAEGGILPIIPGWGINYDAAWTGPNGFVSNEQFLPHAFPGTYHLQASDACGAMLEATFVVPGPTPFVFENAVTLPCDGPQSGAIESTLTGGTPPYALLWNHPEGGTTVGGTAVDIGPGLHLLTATDATGCSIVQGVHVGTDALPYFDWQDTLLHCGGTALAVEAPAGGVYLWGDGSTGAVWEGASDWEVGLHGLALTVTLPTGCWHADTLWVAVEACSGLSIGSEEGPVAPLGPIGNVFPNPASETLHWTWEGEATGWSLVLHAVDGRVVGNWGSDVVQSGRLVRGDWPAGWYVGVWEGPAGRVTRRMHWTGTGKP